MTTAAPGWVPIDDAMPAWRWWTAVITGATAPMLLTPVGDLLPPPWWLGTFVALVLVAVGCGLSATLLRAFSGGRPVDGGRATSWADGSLLLTLAAGVGLVLGIPVMVITGDAGPVAAVSLATSAQLVVARLVRHLVGTVPGAESPRHARLFHPNAIDDDGSTPTAPPTGAPTGPRAEQTSARRLWGWAHSALRWSSAGVVIVALLAAGVAYAGHGFDPLFSSSPALRAALSVLLVASPAALLLSLHLPSSAARDRGRDLGIVYGAADLLTFAGVKRLILDPVGTVTAPEPRLMGVHTVGRLQSTAALQAAASVAATSDDPAHAALVTAARDRAIPLRPCTPSTHALDAPAPASAGDDSRSHESASATPQRPVVRGLIKNTEVTLGPASAFDRVPTQIAEPHLTVFVGWEGVARAGFLVLPHVRSEALTDRPELTTLGVWPVLASTDTAAVDHVGSALEVLPEDRRVLGCADDARSVVQEYAATDGPAFVLGHPRLASAPLPGVFVARRSETHWLDTSTRTNTTPMTSATPGADTAASGASTIVMDRCDLSSAVRSIGLARKAARVSTQGIALVVALDVVALAAATMGLLDPLVAAVVGAALPALSAANAVRPRSYARGDSTEHNESA